ncbi:MAG: hypothetical protein ACRCXZ_00020 [Patescibacteria group bacterium]
MAFVPIIHFLLQTLIVQFMGYGNIYAYLIHYFGTLIFIIYYVRIFFNDVKIKYKNYGKTKNDDVFINKKHSYYTPSNLVKVNGSDGIKITFDASDISVSIDYRISKIYY